MSREIENCNAHWTLETTKIKISATPVENSVVAGFLYLSDSELQDFFMMNVTYVDPYRGILFIYYKLLSDIYSRVDFCPDL